MLGSELPGSALIIAPHADDEAMGCSGLMARIAAAGGRMHVIYGAVDGFLAHLRRQYVPECGVGPDLQPFLYSGSRPQRRLSALGPRLSAKAVRGTASA